MSSGDIAYQRYRQRQFYVWRKQVNKHIPELARRIFALRSAYYRGCGFHYSMEGNLGGVIRQLNDFDTPWDVSRQMVLKVSIAGLFRDVVKAEKSMERLKL